MNDKTETTNNIANILGGEFDARKIEMITPDRIDPWLEFANALEGFGFVLNGPLDTARIVRCALTDSGGDKDGWYVFNIDGNDGWGVWCDWREQVKYSWTSQNLKTLDNAERQHWEARIAQAKRIMQEEQQRNWETAAEKAKEIILYIGVADGHPYLIRKRVLAHGITRALDDLIIPLRNVTGDIRTIQRINPDGDKRFLRGGQVKDCFHLIGLNYSVPTYVAEGYATGATIYQLTGKSVIVTFAAGSTEGVLKSIRDTGVTVPFKICGDNDRKAESEGRVNTGTVKAMQAAQSIPGCDVIIPEFTQPLGSDFNDLATLEPAENAFNQLTASQNGRRLRIVPLNDLGDITETNWQIEDVLPEDSLAMLYGPSGLGKSFVALDMGLCIATGTAWHGRKVAQGPIVYICGEGKNGILKRVEGWCQHHNIDRSTIPFYITTRAAPLLDPETVLGLKTELDGVIEHAGTKPTLIIVDTLARNFGAGDENKTSDMVAFISACDDLRLHCSASLMMVHHTGVMIGDRARGSGVSRDAQDVVFALESGTDDIILLKNTKQKDDDELPEIGFRREVITIGKRKDGAPITSCIMRPVSDIEMGEKAASELLKNQEKSERKSMGKNQKLAFAVLKKYRADVLENNPHIDPITITRKIFSDLLKDQGITVAPRRTELINNFIERDLLVDVNGILCTLNITDVTEWFRT